MNNEVPLKQIVDDLLKKKKHEVTWEVLINKSMLPSGRDGRRPERAQDLLFIYYTLPTKTSNSIR